LLPDRGAYHPDHPLGCHRQRVADRIIFDKLVQVLVFVCGYRKIADQACSATTIRDRRDQWITAGIFATLELLVLQAYDQMIGLEFGDLAVDGCITKAPCGGDVAGRSPVDRGKQGRKRFTVTEARGIPLRTVAAAANRNESPLLGPTLDTMARLGSLPQQPTVHLDRGYDSGKTRAELAEHGMTGQIAERGKPAPVHASQRWPEERAHAWGQPVQEAGLEYRTPRPGHRRVLGICPPDHRATPADPLCLDPVPLGHPTLTTPLSHHPRRC
jgi:transposase